MDAVAHQPVHPIRQGRCDGDASRTLQRRYGLTPLTPPRTTTTTASGDGGKHAAHVDGIIRKCYDEMSFLSILLYINPPEVLNFGGGHFDYLDDGKKEGTWDADHQVARFTQQPISGGAVLFYHSIPHQGRMISVKGKQV